MDSTEIKDMVRARYGGLAAGTLADESAPGSSCCAPANAPFGNSPRDAVRGFGFWQLDLGLTKDFPITERVHFQFRAMRPYLAGPRA